MDLSSGNVASPADALAGQADGLATALVAGAERRSVAAGEWLCRQGELVDALIIVLDGTAECLDGIAPPGSADALAGPGEIAGEVPGRFDRQRGSVRALTAVTYARITGPALASVAALPEAALVRLAGALGLRLRRRQLLARMSRVFGAADEATLDEIEAHAEWLTLRRGDVLVREGDASDALFALVVGRLEVTRRTPAGDTVIGEIGPGESVGEMAFFTGEPRSATARAQRDSVLVRFSNESFERLIARHPGILRQVTRVQIERLRRASVARPPARVTNVAVAPLRSGVPLADVCRRLGQALGAHGAVLHLTAAEVDRRLRTPGLANAPQDGPDDERLVAWLGEQEALYRFVVYEADPAHPSWCARALRQADRVLLVADATADPTPAAEEGRVFDPDVPASRTLVLLHPDGSRLPANTRGWLSPRGLSQHVHVRWTEEGDFGRLARVLAGRAVGLALGGGGARGFAHIGVMRALRESGIPVDMVAGTSMGSAMAAQFAMGWSPDRIVETNRRIWIEIEPHKEYTLPLLSILRSDGALKCGQMMYGDTQLEDLWIPCLCVSSNLTTASMQVHETGSLLWAVTASSSLPGIVVPVLDGQHLLVDGALFNNLPGDLLRERGCGNLLACRVSVEEDRDYAYERVPTLREVVKGKLRRQPDLRYPGLVSVVMRAAMLAGIGRENAVCRDADFLFRPPVERFGMMDFTVLDAVVEAGYRYGLQQIEEWRRAGRLDALTGGA